MKPSRRLVRWVLVALLASAGAGASGASGAPLGVSQLLRSELFTFHSDAFINLHHFLYRWAQVGPGADGAGLDPRIRLRDDDTAAYARMDAGQQERWDYAAAYYRLAMIDRDLLFDQQMVALRDCLVMAGNFCDRIAERDNDTLQVLNEQMGLYRAYFWADHNATNRAWIDDIIPRARRHEADIAPRLAAAYTGSWPDSRNRVDVTIYANRVGGYTTADGHVTVSSIEPGAQGYLGLELLFHEASHGDTLERPLRRLVDDAFAAVDVDAPPDLWHMTIFYTVGHVTRRVLADADVDYPQTYAELAGIFDRGDAGRRAQAALDAHWKNALDAGQGFEAAMTAVARAWAGRQ
jgi:hypothetical protein